MHKHSVFFWFQLVNGKGARKVKTIPKKKEGGRAEWVGGGRDGWGTEDVEGKNKSKSKQKNIRYEKDLNLCSSDPKLLLLTTTLYPLRIFRFTEIIISCNILLLSDVVHFTLR